MNSLYQIKVKISMKRIENFNKLLIKLVIILLSKTAINKEYLQTNLKKQIKKVSYFIADAKKK